MAGVGDDVAAGLASIQLTEHIITFFLSLRALTCCCVLLILSEVLHPAMEQFKHF
jgi:hypothetical protein